jgi:hypothetical protein
MTTARRYPGKHLAVITRPRRDRLIRLSLDVDTAVFLLAQQTGKNLNEMTELLLREALAARPNAPTPCPACAPTAAPGLA